MPDNVCAGPDASGLVRNDSLADTDADPAGSHWGRQKQRVPRPGLPIRQADRDGLAKLPEAAEFLGCTVAALRKWMSQGRLERIKVGRLTRLRWRDLETVMAKGLPAGTSPRRSA